MSIDFTAAMKYPFQRQNWEDGLIFPGIITYVNFTLSFVLSMAVMFLVMSQYGADGIDHEPAKSLVEGINNIISSVMGWFFAIPLNGFAWHYYRKIRQEGIGADLPSWMENWQSFLLSGFWTALFSLFWTTLLVIWFVGLIFGAFILSGVAFSASQPDFSAVIASPAGFLVLILLLFTLIGLLFLHPLWNALLYSTSDRMTLGSLFDFGAMFRQMEGRYGDLVMVILYSILAAILYSIGIGVGCMVTCCLGLLLVPFVTYSLQISIMHMYAQVFSEGGEQSPTN